jgi:hypothetical protein
MFTNIQTQYDYIRSCGHEDADHRRWNIVQTINTNTKYEMCCDLNTPLWQLETTLNIFTGPFRRKKNGSHCIYIHG